MHGRIGNGRYCDQVFRGSGGKGDGGPTVEGREGKNTFARGGQVGVIVFVSPFLLINAVVRLTEGVELLNC
mgnify:CR=1 FL=1